MMFSTNAAWRLWILICCYFLFGYLAATFFPAPVAEPVSQPSKLFMSLYSVVSFLLPVLVVRKLSRAKGVLIDRQPKAPLTLWIVVLVVLAMVFAFVVMNWLGYLNQQLPIPESMRAMEAKQMEEQQRFLKMDSVALLLYNLLIFSLVPSFCEEVFFRGTMQPLWMKIAGRKWLAVLLTAAIFSFLHFQFLGFLPRLFAGMVIGMVFLFSNNLALAVVCHIVHNGSLVVFSYMEQHHGFSMIAFQERMLSEYLIMGAGVLLLVTLYQLYKATRKGRY